MACARELRTGLLLLLCCFAPPDLYAGETAIRHSTYEEFIQGSLGDGGARTYISRRGRVQLIPRWDLNRDGYLDVVFNQDHNPVENVDAFIYWGSAEGYRSLFPPFWKEVLPTYKLFKSLVENRRHISFLPTFGGGPVRVADLNRDGHPDIVLMNQLSGRKAGEIPSLIFWGNSAHHYSEANAALIPAPAKPYFSKVADFDDDGYPDLVFSGVSPFLLWGGPRGFLRTFRFGLDARTTGIDVADYDRDGYLDVIFLVMSRDPSVRHYGLIYLGGADGFSAGRTLRVAPRAYKSLYLATADLDRDGFLDLIFGGTETPDQLSEIVWGGRSGFSERPSTLLKTNWVNVPAVADLDRNGWLDIVFPGRMDALTQSTHTRSLIMWGGTNGFSEKNRTELEAFNASVIRVSDLNRDGSLDLVSSNYKAEQTRRLPVFIYWGSGGAGYENRRRTELPAESSCGIQLLDLNQDRYPEIVVNNHIKDGDHNFGAYLYWGGEEGYSVQRRTHLPTAGTHFAHGIAPGNIYDRGPEYDYLSRVLPIPDKRRFLVPEWRGETPHNTSIRMQLRFGPDQSPLTGAAWRETGRGECHSLNEDSAALQYRAVLVSPDGGNSPVLEQVVLRFVDSCP